jgi:hypothetical protein
MKFEEYWSGVDKEPLRMELKPETSKNDHSNQQKKTNFLAKIGAKDNSNNNQSSQPSG